MKNNIMKLLAGILIFTAIPNMHAQTNNWSKLELAKNNARVYGGIDYGLTYGFQYGIVIKTKRIVWVPCVDASAPLGNNVVDDYKLKIGTSAKLFQHKDWIVSADISIVNRQNRNPFVRMQSLGAEAGIQIGYYRPKWFANIHFSTDNSFISNLKHSEAYKGNYAGVKDGWYQNPANNQLLGLNIGYSFKKIDMTLSPGVIRTEGFKSKPGLPFYAKIGINYRF